MTAVSVVIPCYNLAHVLPRAVESVVRQTLDKSSWEVIIVNDASPDNTAQVADKLVDAYSGYNIRVISHPVNRHLASALNTGANVATGRYVLNLDSDNELPPGALKLLTTELDTNREVDIVYGGMEIVEEDGKHWIPKWPQTFDYEALVYGHVNQIHSSAMWRKSVWERICGYRTRCRTGEDAEFWCRATTLGFVPYKLTDVPTLIYYNRRDSMSHTTVDWDWTCWMPKVRGKSPIGISQHTHTEVRPGHQFKQAPIAPYISISDPIMVSVIIPCGPGHEQYILDAIDSVWAQTFDYWECIVVNDGADLPKLPSFVKVVSSANGDQNKTAQVPLGPAVARNRGIKTAKGQYVLFLDADDFLEPTAIELMYGCVQQFPDGYAYTDWVELEKGTKHESLEHDCSALLNSIYHPNTILVKKGVAYYDEQLNSWEDWDYALELGKAGVYGVRVPLPLVHVRMGSSLVKAKLFARTQEALAELHTKWEDNMPGCTSCGGRRYHAPANVRGAGNAGSTNRAFRNGRSAAPTNVKPSADGTELDMPRAMVDVVYTGAGSPSVRGKSTGVMYYFNGTAPVVKAVYESDWNAGINLMEGFALYVEVEQLVAVS